MSSWCRLLWRGFESGPVQRLLLPPKARDQYTKHEDRDRWFGYTGIPRAKVEDFGRVDFPVAVSLSCD